MLPAINNKIIRRPGDTPQSHFVPNSDAEFWDTFYALSSRKLQLFQPIPGIEGLVNPYSGRFGFRWHPVAGKPEYFHIGIDAHTHAGTPISAIDQGLFEYSGYAALNGNYIVVSHPHIVCEDGFVLNSIYMHCDTMAHRFNLAQKICRKYISKAPEWVNIPIRKSETLATVGSTGVEGGYAPHLHLQLDFVSPDQTKRVSVDPLRMLGLSERHNLTSEIHDIDEFRRFYERHKEDMALWSKFIETYI